MNRLLFSPRSVLLAVLAAGLFAGCSSSRTASLPPEAADPTVLAVVGDEVITVEELERRFTRSAGVADDAPADSAALREFLDRYVNFRLKVEAARDAGLAQNPQVQEEIETYRLQLARPYMLEQDVIEPLVQDLYTKTRETVDASHILIRLGPDAPPADTLAAYQKMEAILDSLAAGADFGDLAYANSEDPSARNARQGPGFRGRLGFFTAGQMVAPFEDAAYATPVGEVSDIFRTQFGYHILKVHDRQPVEPQLDVAHIMLILPGDATAEDSAAARATLTDVKQRVAAGEEFSTLARELSMDRNSKPNGGRLGFISKHNAVIPEPFREAAFSLSEQGEVSDIVETRFGLHLIQLLGREELKSYEESYEELKAQVTRLPRAQQAEQAYAADALAQHGTRVDTSLIGQLLGSVEADTLFARLNAGDAGTLVPDTTFATIGETRYSLEDFLTFAVGRRVQPGGGLEARLVDLIEPYMHERALDYEASLLEDRDAEFGQLMAEFRDGLLLFRIMEDSVWNAAAQDSVGLQAYYEAHRDTYQFDDRTRVVGFYSPDDSLLAAVAARLDAGDALAAVQADLAADSLANVRMDTTLIAGATNSIYDQAIELEPGQRTQVLPYRGSHALLINDGIEPARAKTFEEARSEVVSDYQEVLEAELLDALRARYRLFVFPERLGQAFAAPDAAADATSTSSSR